MTEARKRFASSSIEILPRGGTPRPIAYIPLSSGSFRLNRDSDWSCAAITSSAPHLVVTNPLRKPPPFALR